jgi:hypothetical protein
MPEYNTRRRDRVEASASRRREILIRISGLLLERERSVSPGAA